MGDFGSLKTFDMMKHLGYDTCVAFGRGTSIIVHFLQQAKSAQADPAVKSKIPALESERESIDSTVQLLNSRPILVYWEGKRIGICVGKTIIIEAYMGSTVGWLCAIPEDQQFAFA